MKALITINMNIKTKFNLDFWFKRLKNKSQKKKGVACPCTCVLQILPPHGDAFFFFLFPIFLSPRSYRGLLDLLKANLSQDQANMS